VGWIARIRILEVAGIFIFIIIYISSQRLTHPRIRWIPWDLSEGWFCWSTKLLLVPRSKMQSCTSVPLTCCHGVVLRCGASFTFNIRLLYISTNLFFVILPLKEKKWSYKITMLSLCYTVFVCPFQLLNHLTSFSQNMVWMLYYWRLPCQLTFEFHAVSNNMVDEQQ
jgi:hypothetical protein